MTILENAVRAEGPLSSAAGEVPGEEATLVREAAAGDARAFETLVRSHSRRVYNFLYQMTRQSQDAEDLAQQTFIKAHRNLHRFDHARPLINWLLVIARRTALNHFRGSRKFEEVPADAATSGPSPARVVEQRDQTETLWAKARRVLSNHEYEALWLRFAEELSTRETADVLGLTETHVKVLVFRARQALMKGEQSS